VSVLRSPSTLNPSETTVARVILYFVAIALVSNVGAVVDGVMNLEIPYFDEEHLIVGGIVALTMILLVAALEALLSRGKRADEELARLVHRNELILGSAAEGIIGLDAEGNQVFVNTSAARMLGYEVEELLGVHSHSLLHHTKPDGSPYPEEECKIYASHRNGTVHRVSTEVFWRKDGSSFPVEYTSTPIDQWGRVVGGVLTFTDITERKRLEEERRALERQFHQSQKLESLGVLAGGVAHDFNNILTSVIGNAELALSELLPTAPIRENLLEIREGSRRAAALARQMLAYSGRGIFASELIDLSELIENMSDLLTSMVSKKTFLDLNLGSDLPLLQGDPAQLGQLVMNLVINASEAIGDANGVITVTTGARECTAEYLREFHFHEEPPPGLYVTLDVSDNGCGMDPETQDHLFDPFFTTKFTGRGLGLAVVLGVVRGHKGTYRVHSQPGRGSTFEFRLPTAKAGVGALLPSDTPETNARKAQGSVLLVDDEETIRSTTARMLSSFGFAVIAAADGREALRLYAQHQDEITVVLLDLTMPHMDGEETFRKLRLIDPQVRVVISSGYAEHDITTRLGGDHAVGFVPKPYTLAELREGLLGTSTDGTATAVS